MWTHSFLKIIKHWPNIVTHRVLSTSPGSNVGVTFPSTGQCVETVKSLYLSQLGWSSQRGGFLERGHYIWCYCGIVEWFTKIKLCYCMSTVCTLFLDIVDRTYGTCNKVCSNTGFLVANMIAHTQGNHGGVATLYKCEGFRCPGGVQTSWGLHC